MNEPAIRTEEQIISLFPDRETLICWGWVLKRMERQLLVYPLYYKFSEGDIPENILLSKGGLKVDLQNEKCVMVIDENLPLGIIANTAAIMGITLGKQMPEVVGADVYDRTGNGHLGIIEFPVPILKGNVEVIKSIREKLYEPEFSDLTVVDFSDLAQGCKTYDEFIEKMKDVSETELNYFGIAICGAKKKVNKLTGSMALLR